MVKEEYIISGNRIFKIVDKVEKPYMIWNIGKNMKEGFLPLCRLKYGQPFEGAAHIETDSLKAIRCPGAQVILAAIGWGPLTCREMEAYIEKHKYDRNSKHAIRCMKKALPLMRKVEGL